jgi:hypothetical protein
MGIEHKTNHPGQPEISPERQRQLISRLSKTQTVKQQLKANHSSWRARPRGTELDVGFTKKGSYNIRFAPLNIFGQSRCVGFAIAENITEIESTKQKLLAEPRLQELIDQGAEIVVLTPTQFLEWVKFYEALDQTQALREMGERDIESSGLRPATEDDCQVSQQIIDDLLDTHQPELSERGVAQIAAAHGLDIAFLDNDKQLMTVDIVNIKLPFGDHPDLLREIIYDESLPCPGFVIREAGETKREVYQRAQQLENQLQTYFDEEITVPIISPGQTSIWEKLGFLEPNPPVIDGVSVSTQEVARHLFLGEDTFHPGELATAGLSLPGEGSEFGLDMVLYHRNQEGTPVLKTIDNLIGLIPTGKNGPKLGSIDNVGGILIIPDDWSSVEIKDYLSHHLPDYSFEYRKGKSETNILLVNREVIDSWQENSSAFGEPREEEPDEKSNGEKFYGRSHTKHDLLVYSQNEIGGAKLAIRSKNGAEDTQITVLDWGTSYKTGPKGFSSLDAQPPSSVGLREHLSTGQLPMIPIYDPEYMLASIKTYPAILNPLNPSPTASFLRATIAHDVPREEIVQVLGPTKTDKLLSLAKKDQKRWYPDGKNIVLNGIFPSHAHIDHIGQIFALHHQAPIYARTDTIGHLMAKNARAKNWRKKPLTISQLTKPKRGAAYQRLERETLPIHSDSETVRLGGLTIQMPLVDHSIPGAAMVGVHMQGGDFLYTGDLKMGPNTENAVAMMAGNFGVIYMETTNALEGGKASMGITEAEVKANFGEIFADPTNKNRPIVIITPDNHSERLTSILEVADAHNRKVAISDRHAETVSQLRAARETAPTNAQLHDDIFLPEIGVDAALWTKPLAEGMSRPPKYQRALMAQAEQGPLGILSAEQLGEEYSNWVIVLGPHDILPYHLGGIYFPHGLAVVYSSYFVYEDRAKYLVGANRKWLREIVANGSRLYADFTTYGQGGIVVPDGKFGIHASGHATMEEMIGQVLIPLLGNPKGKHLILGHGEHPVKYARVIKKTLGLDHPDDLKIHAKFKRYNPRKPDSGGFTLRIG